MHQAVSILFNLFFNEHGFMFDLSIIFKNLPLRPHLHSPPAKKGNIYFQIYYLILQPSVVFCAVPEGYTLVAESTFPVVFLSL